jgi:hypothetical protein
MTLIFFLFSDVSDISSFSCDKACVGSGLRDFDQLAWTQRQSVRLGICSHGFIAASGFVERVIFAGLNVNSNATTLWFLANFTQHSPPWELTVRSHSQEIPRFLRNKQFYYRAHNSPSPVSTLS